MQLHPQAQHRHLLHHCYYYLHRLNCASWAIGCDEVGLAPQGKKGGALAPTGCDSLEQRI